MLFRSPRADPNIMDPLARQCVTADGFVMIVSKLMQSAAALCGDKLVLIQEGYVNASWLPAIRLNCSTFPVATVRTTFQSVFIECEEASSLPVNQF